MNSIIDELKPYFEDQSLIKKSNIEFIDLIKLLKVEDFKDLIYNGTDNYEFISFLLLEYQTVILSESMNGSIRYDFIASHGYLASMWYDILNLVKADYANSKRDIVKNRNEFLLNDIKVTADDLSKSHALFIKKSKIDDSEKNGHGEKNTLHETYDNTRIEVQINEPNECQIKEKLKNIILTRKLDDFVEKVIKWRSKYKDEILYDAKLNTKGCYAAFFWVISRKYKDEYFNVNSRKNFTKFQSVCDFIFNCDTTTFKPNKLNKPMKYIEKFVWVDQIEKFPFNSPL